VARIRIGFGEVDGNRIEPEKDQIIRGIEDEKRSLGVADEPSWKQITSQRPRGCAAQGMMDTGTWKHQK
jgi:hypothetical protein